MSKNHQAKATRPIDKGIIIVDYGSQYTLLIVRRLREIGVYAEVVDSHRSQPPGDFNIAGIILSGGPDTVTDAGARTLPEWVLASNKPVLGICYGMQLLMHAFGGRLRSGKGREYGKSQIMLNSEIAAPAGAMFYETPTKQIVWMSHGDDVEGLPKGFVEVARSEDGICAAAVHESKAIIGLQFHPEVEHSAYGSQMLRQFVTTICKTTLNWEPHAMVDATSQYIRDTVGSGRVLMAVSGGVDSTVAAMLMSKVLGNDRVKKVFVDHGLLRANERQWVLDNFKFLGVQNLEVLDCADLFLRKLSGVSDPEQKRKIIGNTFVEVFEDFAKHQQGITHLGQGTLYPDVIESAGHGSGAKVIKSHHNVGGLPDHLNFSLVEPFRYLFKDEVRAIGSELGINPAMIMRHPFPGPGLAIRIIGPVTAEDLELLRAADLIFTEALRERGLYDQVWQAFAVLLPVKSVGVMGDNRTYQKTCALRAVLASDGMTAAAADLDIKFLHEVADRIVRRVPGINRVVYDLTGKPPATIEWE